MLLRWASGERGLPRVSKDAEVLIQLRIEPGRLRKSGHCFERTGEATSMKPDGPASHCPQRASGMGKRTRSS